MDNNNDNFKREKIYNSENTKNKLVLLRLNIVGTNIYPENTRLFVVM